MNITSTIIRHTVILLFLLIPSLTPCTPTPLSTCTSSTTTGSSVTACLRTYNEYIHKCMLYTNKEVSKELRPESY